MLYTPLSNEEVSEERYVLFCEIQIVPTPQPLSLSLSLSLTSLLLGFNGLLWLIV